MYTVLKNGAAIGYVYYEADGQVTAIDTANKFTAKFTDQNDKAVAAGLSCALLVDGVAVETVAVAATGCVFTSGQAKNTILKVTSTATPAAYKTKELSLSEYGYQQTITVALQPVVKATVTVYKQEDDAVL